VYRTRFVSATVAGSAVLAIASGAAAQQSNVSITPFVSFLPSAGTSPLAGLALTLAGNGGIGLRASGHLALENSKTAGLGTAGTMRPWGADVRHRMVGTHPDAVRCAVYTMNSFHQLPVSRFLRHRSTTIGSDRLAGFLARLTVLGFSNPAPWVAPPLNVCFCYRSLPGSTTTIRSAAPLRALRLVATPCSAPRQQKSAP